MPNPENKSALDPWIIEEKLRQEKKREQQDNRIEISIPRHTPEIEENPTTPKQEDRGWRRGVEEMEI